MEHRDDKRDEIHEKLVEDLRAGYVRRDREFAKFLWYGAPDAPLVQRIGVCLIGSPFLLVGLLAVGGAFRPTMKEDRLPLGILGTLVLYVGARILRNGLLRRARPRESPK